MKTIVERYEKRQQKQTIRAELDIQALVDLHDENMRPRHPPNNGVGFI